MAGAVKSWRGAIALGYRYTAGVAGEKFLRGLKAGKLLATRCESCGVTYLPPRIYCERCLGRLDSWLEVKPEGSLYSYTVTHPKGRVAVVGLARFKGVEGGILAPIASDGRRLKIGAPVKIRFEAGKAEIVA